MAAVKKLIERIELDSAAASITFSDIPDTFTDLLVVLSGRSNKAADVADVLELSFNADTANRTSRRLYGNGSGAASDSFTNGRIGLINATSSTSSSFSNTSIYIPNYRSSVAKSASIDNVLENNATTGFQEIFAFLWNDTAPITSVTLDFSSGSFVQYTSASLYGMRKGSDGTTTVS